MADMHGRATVQRLRRALQSLVSGRKGAGRCSCRFTSEVRSINLSAEDGKEEI